MIGSDAGEDRYTFATVEETWEHDTLAELRMRDAVARQVRVADLAFDLRAEREVGALERVREQRLAGFSVNDRTLQANRIFRHGSAG